MNFRLVAKMLGVLAMLIGATMVFSLPWAHPALGYRPEIASETGVFEDKGFFALLLSTSISMCLGGALYWWGRSATGALYRKEAMAIVGASWILATVLGALPYLISGCERAEGDPMTVADALFESQSGFSTTGATVIADLEQPGVPHCILFWRSSTHFLGGLGIVVLFVAILGMGSTGKAMMRAEITGPNKDGVHSRTQQSAWLFAGIYVGLNVVLAVILMVVGKMTLFDALCHAFGTMATGGFSTYNASVGHFNSPIIEYIIIVFMILAGVNFTLLAFSLLRGPMGMLKDTEFRVYVAIILFATIAVLAFGLPNGDFERNGETSYEAAFRWSLFQIVAVITTTGYGTADFDLWADSSRILILVLMFVGGCAGSTGGGMKVIRHILFYKILVVEVEQAYRPSIVRTLRLDGKALEDPKLRQNILVYFGIILGLFIASWLFVVTFERDAVWANSTNKLIDSASAVASMINNIGPGFGVVGPTRNYMEFSSYTKIWFVGLMMIGRLEIYSVLVLFLPGFWRNR